MMVKHFPVAEEPRDPNKMSPHHHDDFEQCSLTLQGDFMHYIRWPWTVNKAIWRDDAKIRCSAPSITIIPPPAIHTSQALAPAPCHLIDIFGRSEEHTSELQSLMRISYAVFCLKKTNNIYPITSSV